MRWFQTIGLIAAAVFVWGCKTSTGPIDNEVVVKGWVKRAGYYSVVNYPSVTVSDLVKLAGGLEVQTSASDEAFQAKLFTTPETSPTIVKREKWDVPLSDFLVEPRELRCLIIEKRME